MFSAMLKIVCTEDLPCAREAFSTLGDVLIRRDSDLTPADLADADLFAMRSGTRVDAALLAGLSFLSGRARIGLVGSIGARRSPGARETLSRLAGDAGEHAEIRAIATRALALLRPASTGPAA
jgi:hypothetical protein